MINFINLKVNYFLRNLLFLKSYFFILLGEVAVKRKVVIEDVLGLFYAGDPVLFLVNMKTINCCFILLFVYLLWLVSVIFSYLFYFISIISNLLFIF